MDGKEKKRGVKYCGISIPTVLISRLHGVNKKLMVPTYFLTSFPVTSLNSGSEVGKIAIYVDSYVVNIET